MNKNKSNKSHAIPTLDLHGMVLEGIEDKVDRFIVQAQNKGLNRVRIMTGKGSGKIRTAVQTYLKLGAYAFQFEKLPNNQPNEGVLLVFI